jgi:hypothetical protein
VCDGSPARRRSARGGRLPRAGSAIAFEKRDEEARCD